MTDRKDRPNQWPWPPMILAIAIIIAWSLGRIAPIPLAPAWPAVGLGLIAIALAIDVTAMIMMQRARTNILPTHPARTLLTGGIFGWSRNPIYVANIIILIGAGFWGGNGWYWLSAPVAVVAINKLAIEREEAHLSANFGDAFAAYKNRVRRWI